MNQPEPDTVQVQFKAKVERWLREDGWSLNEAPREGFSWRLLAEDNAKRKVMVLQREHRADQIIMEAGVTIGGGQLGRFEALTEAERQAILNRLKLELARAGYNYNGLELPFKAVGLSEVSYLDGLTKDVFMHRIQNLRRAVVLVSIVMQDALQA